jgi:hypothetical protein
MLVSMRDTWAAYLIDIKTGKIEWTLGGRHSDFSFGPKAGFAWQHDVFMRPDSTITMFDDHCCQITGGGTYVSPTAPSRGLTIKVDQSAKKATFLHEFSKGASFDADYMGSSQALPNGGQFVGWGSEPYLSEYGPDGKLLLDVVLPRPDLSYRATLEPQWVGTPYYPPSGAARVSGGKTTVYASWNGDTQLAGWRVLAGPSAGALKPLTTVGKAGFETAIPIKQAGVRVFRVQAVDSTGKILGTSQQFTAGG